MLKRLLLVSAVLLPLPAYAQPAQPYAAPDAELWGIMERAIHDLSMPEAAHQAIRQIMQNVQNEARMRQARKEPPAAPPAEQPK